MAKVNKFGTFSGVFTPSILTILGVIMYLRLPMIIGEAGLWPTIGIIVIAHIISVTTGLSVSSIATDKKVAAGGTYFMISRSLGLPIGGTLGLALFVGLSFSVSLYLIGFAESFLSFWGFELSINAIRLAGTIILLVVTTITLISTSLAIKTQYFIMAAIILSLISILLGNHDFAPQQAFQSMGSATSAVPFMVLFGIFFPAVTGFEAGVSMSGDLKDPKRSIPQGTILAIVIGLAVYIALAAFFALTVDREVLATDSQVLLKISWIPELVIAGIWGATLSSALGSILGAPRILQATAGDNITPRFFSKGVGASNEPRNALMLTFLIAECGILIGDLDVIARIVSIFFITTYGFLNLSCAFEAWTSADFRPSFKTPVWVSLLGAAACFIVMIELDFVATLGASVILGVLYFYLKRKELALHSGDTWAGVWSSLVKTSLLRLTTAKKHNRNWRPNILMFNGADSARPFMLSLGNAISGKLGLLSSFELIKSNDLLKPQRSVETEDDDTKVFRNTYTCTDIYSGIDEIARVYGYSGIEPNTILMGWSIKPENKEKFIRLISRIQGYNLNSLFLYHHASAKKITTPSVDVWWSGWGRNLSFALNLLRHLTSSYPWNQSNVRICIIINNDEDTERINRYAKNVVLQYRAKANIKIIDNHIAQLRHKEIIANESASADLTIIGIPDGSYDDLETTYQFAHEICEQLKSVLLINACNIFEDHSIVSQQAAASASIKKNEWVLPEIPTSRYSEINDDIRKIDERGLQLTEALNKKIFVACFNPESTIYDNLSSLAETTASALNKVVKYDQPYQRSSAVMRTKKHFNTQIARLLDDALENVVHSQEEILQEGMQWYLEQLEADSNRFPKQLSVHYARTEFDPNKEDSPAHRWYKFKRRVLNPFSRKSISLKVNYREGATYFLRDRRYHFLTVLLDDLGKYLTASRENFRHFISWADESFQRVLSTQDSLQQNEEIKGFVLDLREKEQTLRTQLLDLQSLYKGRLQVEYRKNVIFFMQQLERIDFNNYIQKKRRYRKFYLTRKESLSGYPAEWSEKATLDLNTIKSSALLYDYFGLVQHEIQGFHARLKQLFDKEQVQPVSRLIDSLTAVAAAPVKSKTPSLPEWEFNHDFATEKLREITDKLLSTASVLPEESTVSIQFDGKVEGLTLPIRAMASHLTETTLAGPLNDILEELLEKVRRSNLIVNDQASLAMFNIYNLEETDEESLRPEEINRAVRAIKHEMELMKNAFESTLQEIDRQCSELQSALRIHHLTDLSGDFSTLVRRRRKEHLQGRLSEKLAQVVDMVKRTLVSLLYSQAKGVLLARQLSSSAQSLSVNERILNVVGSVTPDQGILQRLPHYYVSLFSGRSNIGDNFWVARPDEEKQFTVAQQRYLVSRQGMLLVLGERNTGKTALCKHFAESASGTFTPYHIFPPEDGTVAIDQFEAAMRKVTKFDGDATQILSLLPHNSMIVIHDLEMWWERTEENGLTMIRYLKSLVEEFSAKCLFIVNMNPYAFAVINTAEQLDTHCAGIIRCVPFNSFELKQLVMTRHKSSGLSLNFGSGVTDKFGEIRLARIFNNLFAYSKGNPGVAMNAWLAGIQDYADKTISWRAPVIKDGDVFAEMPETWAHLCLQLLLHKRMSLEKIVRSVQLDKDQITESLAVLKRLQLVSIRGNSIYYLNPNIEFLLIKHFTEKEWI